MLSKAAADAIRRELKSDCVSIAAVTLWELSWLATNGRIDPGGTVPAFLKKITAGVVILPLTVEIAAQPAAFPMASCQKIPLIG